MPVNREATGQAELEANARGADPRPGVRTLQPALRGWIRPSELELQHLALQLTKVRKEYPEFKSHRKLSITTLKRAVTAREGHTNPREGTNPRGKPRQERFRTIALDSPVHPIIRSSVQAGNPYLCIKGLPNLRIITHRELPEDQQPSRVSITLAKYPSGSPTDKLHIQNPNRSESYARPAA